MKENKFINISAALDTNLAKKIINDIEKLKPIVKSCHIISYLDFISNNIPQAFGINIINYKGYEFYTEEMFFKLITYFNFIYKTDEFKNEKAILGCIHLYKELIRNGLAGQELLDAKIIDYNVLKYNLMKKVLIENNPIFLFSSTLKIEGISKFLLVIKTYYKHSNEIKKTECMSIDFSTIKNELYLNICVQYFLKGIGSLKSKREYFSYIKDVVAAFSSYKENRFKTINLDINLIDREDILFLLNYVKTNKTTEHTYIKSLQILSIFLEYCRSAKLLSISKSLINKLYPKNKVYPRNNSKKIPKEDLLKIINVSFDRSLESNRNKMMHLALGILLQTNIRATNLFELSKDDIKKLMDENIYYFQIETKVSHGLDVKKVITTKIYESLIEHTEYLNEIRNKHDYITENHFFIYEADSRIVFITLRMFNSYISELLTIAGIDKKYTSSNIRDTYMNLSIQFTDASNLGYFVEKLLTGHANPSTTINHYYDGTYSELNEVMKDSNIGDEYHNYYKNIISIDEYRKISNKNIIDNELGKCKSSLGCLNQHLSCLTCSKFVTTVENKSYFEALIQLYNDTMEDFPPGYLTKIKDTIFLLEGYLTAIKLIENNGLDYD